MSNEPTISPSSPQSFELIRNFLKQQRSGVLATADSRSKPHAATIYFSVDDTLRLLFTTKTDTQKYKNIIQNNQIALVCYDEKTQTSIQLTGTTQPITNADEQQAALNTMYRFSETVSRVELPPLEKLSAGDYVALRILPVTIKMAVFARPDAQSNEELYETLTFTY